MRDGKKIILPYSDMRKGQQERGSKWVSILPWMLPVVLALLSYGNTLENGFVYDDLITVQESAFIRDISLLPHLFTPRYFLYTQELSYRPIVTFTYFVDYALWKDRPVGYHFTNLICHIVCVVLLYFVAREMNLSPVWASCAAGIFAVHPAASEAVNGISFREDILALLFCLAATVRFLDGRGARAWISLLFVLSLLSKESGMVLPLILLLWWPRLRERKAFLRRWMPLGILLLLFVGLRWMLLRWAGTGEIEPWGLKDRLLICPKILTLYLRLTVWPHPLSAEYVFFPLSSPWDLQFLFPLGIMIFVSSVSFLLWWKGSRIGLGCLWFLVGLLPVSNLVPLPNMAAERFLYLSLAGACLAFAAVGSTLSRDLSGRRPLKNHARDAWTWIVLASMAWVFFPLISLTWKRNRIWKDEITFCRATVAQCPQSDRFRYNLASACWDQGLLDEAEEILRYLIDKDPRHLDAKISLSALYTETGRSEDAMDLLLSIVETDPHAYQAWINLVVVYVREERIEEALAAAHQSIQVSGGHPTALTNRGRLLMDLGRLEEAMVDLRMAFARSASVDLAVDLAIVATELGNWDEGEFWFQQAFSLSPKDPYVKRSHDMFLLRKKGWTP